MVRSEIKNLANENIMEYACVYIEYNKRLVGWEMGNNQQLSKVES